MNRGSALCFADEKHVSKTPIYRERFDETLLKPGDVVQIEISELGTLENRVIPSCKEGF